jgi:hypothetical protein
VRLDHLLSRVREPDPTTDPSSTVLPLTVWGAGLNGKFASCHYSVVKVVPRACSSVG